MSGRTANRAARSRYLLFAFIVASTLLTLVPAAAVEVELCAGLEVTIVGTDGDDPDLNGTFGPDVIAGLGGNDTINGLGGDDVICGGDGDDTILGGWGSDTIYGDDGNDTIDGEGAGDSIDGGKGKDVLAGSGGADLVVGGGGNDTITGGTGNDDLRGGYGLDVIDGGDGNDVLSGGTADDTLLGGNGADELRGNAGNDLLKGQAGNDLLDGGNQDDELRGGNGADDIRGGKGNDVGYGAGGKDQLRGGNDDDTLFGGSDADVLSGYAGADVVNGGPDNDDCLGETEIACEDGLIDFGFERFYINQAVPAADSSDAPADQIQPVVGRPGIVRAFFNANRFDSEYRPTVVLHWMKTGGEMGEVELDGPSSLKVAVNESKLGDTHNLVFDETFLEEGMKFYVEVDPGDEVLESLENNNRYPATGWLDPGVTPVPMFEIVFVPIGLDGGDPPQVTEASGLALLEDTIDVHPIADVDIQIHDPIDYSPVLGSSQDWILMLEKIRDLACGVPCAFDQPPPYYMGIVGSDPSGLGIAGIGYVNATPNWVWPYAVSRPIASTVAHELGHNFGRYHVQCSGSEGGADPDYPYDTGGLYGLGGRIGTWGYEADTGLLKDPAIYNDVMTYCPDEWISDYTYSGVLDFRTSDRGFDMVEVPSGSTVVAFSGSLGGHEASISRIPDLGVPGATLQTATVTVTRVPEIRAGDHQIVGLDVFGNVVVSSFFPTVAVADTLHLTDVRHFSFALVVDDDDPGRIVRWEIRDALGLVAFEAVE